MEQRITRSTLAGGRVESGDRGLASPVKQTPIPRSGSFTEVCTVFSEGWTGLGKGSVGRSTVAGGSGGRGHAVHGQTPVVLGSGEVERVRRGTVKVPGCFIGAGVGHGAGWALARRGARGARVGRALASQSASNTWSLLSALVLAPAEQPNVQILPYGLEDMVAPSLVCLHCSTRDKTGANSCQTVLAWVQTLQGGSLDNLAPFCYLDPEVLVSLAR
jgi:hypothetical protein